jgi:hypothetical protein
MSDERLVSLLIQIPSDLRVRLRVEAAKSQRTMSSLVSAAIERALAALELERADHGR